MTSDHEAQCYCESCIRLRENRPDLRRIRGHIVSLSDEGTIGYIPADAPVMREARRRATPRNWLKQALR